VNGLELLVLAAGHVLVAGHHELPRIRVPALQDLDPLRALETGRIHDVLRRVEEARRILQRLLEVDRLVGHGSTLSGRRDACRFW
jgi:hypothetical protein